LLYAQLSSSDCCFTHSYFPATVAIRTVIFQRPLRYAQLSSSDCCFTHSYLPATVALRTVIFQRRLRYAQLFSSDYTKSTVSFCVLFSIPFTSHCSTTLGRTNRKRIKYFYSFLKQKGNQTEMSI
jgi:hypothetical protein